MFYRSADVLITSTHMVILSPVEQRFRLEEIEAAYIVKHVDPRDLPSALRQAVEGTVFQPLGARERVTNGAAEDVELTKREQTILEALQTGRSNKQIAEKLFLAEQTVKFHLTNIYRKLDVSNRTEAVRYAHDHAIVERPLAHAVG